MNGELAELANAGALVAPGSNPLIVQIYHSPRPYCLFGNAVKTEITSPDVKTRCQGSGKGKLLTKPDSLE